MQILYPLAEFEDEAIENGQLVFQLVVCGGVGGGGAGVPRLPHRRRLVGPYIPCKNRLGEWTGSVTSGARRRRRVELGRPRNKFPAIEVHSRQIERGGVKSFRLG
jgi:hypothetical protein